MTLRYSIISGSVKTVPPKFFAKWEAANGLCCVCATDLPKAGETFTKNRAPTLEHVFPKSPAANALAKIAVLRKLVCGANRTALAHAKCNRDKGNRAPTGCEAVFLMAVNLRLGHVTRDGDTPNKRTKMRKARRVFSKQRRAELARIMQDECS